MSDRPISTEQLKAGMEYWADKDLNKLRAVISCFANKNGLKWFSTAFSPIDELPSQAHPKRNENGVKRSYSQVLRSSTGNEAIQNGNGSNRKRVKIGNYDPESRIVMHLLTCDGLEAGKLKEEMENEIFVHRDVSVKWEEKKGFGRKPNVIQLWLEERLLSSEDKSKDLDYTTLVVGIIRLLKAKGYGVKPFGVKLEEIFEKVHTKVAFAERVICVVVPWQNSVLAVPLTGEIEKLYPRTLVEIVCVFKMPTDKEYWIYTEDIDNVGPLISVMESEMKDRQLKMLIGDELHQEAVLRCRRFIDLAQSTFDYEVEVQVEVVEELDKGEVDYRAIIRDNLIKDMDSASDAQHDRVEAIRTQMGFDADGLVTGFVVTDDTVVDEKAKLKQIDAQIGLLSQMADIEDATYLPMVLLYGRHYIKLRDSQFDAVDVRDGAWKRWVEGKGDQLPHGWTAIRQFVRAVKCSAKWPQVHWRGVCEVLKWRVMRNKWTALDKACSEEGLMPVE